MKISLLSLSFFYHKKIGWNKFFFDQNKLMQQIKLSDNWIHSQYNVKIYKDRWGSGLAREPFGFGGTKTATSSFRIIIYIVSASTDRQCRPVTPLLENRVVILIGWLSTHLHNYV